MALFRRKALTTPTPFVLRDMSRLGITAIADSDVSYISNGYESNADLYAVINLLTANAANMKPCLYQYKADGTEVEIERHALLDLMKQPEPGLTYRRFISQGFGYYLITGNTYIWGPKLDIGINTGKVTRLMVLPSQYTREVIEDGAVVAYKVSAGDFQKVIPAEEILHVRTPQFSYGSGQQFRGMSPLKAALMNIAASNDGIKSQAYRFQNNGSDGALGVKDAITDEQRKALQAKLDSMSGPTNAGRITVLSSGLEYVNYGLSPADLQILQTVGWNRTVFANIYGVDPHLVDPTVGSTYNNQKEASASMYTRAIIPFMDELYNGLNNWLVPAYGKDLELEADDSDIKELQKDKESNVRWLTQAWWLTGNEKRREIDYEPIDDPDMDIILYPSNVMPTDPTLTDTQLGKHGVPDYRT